MIAVFGVTAIISKPGRSFPHWLASILSVSFHCFLSLVWKHGEPCWFRYSLFATSWLWNGQLDWFKIKFLPVWLGYDAPWRRLGHGSHEEFLPWLYQVCTTVHVSAKIDVTSRPLRVSVTFTVLRLCQADNGMQSFKHPALKRPGK